MDPQAVLQRLLDLDPDARNSEDPEDPDADHMYKPAIDGGDILEVEAAANDLLRWLSRGGDKPTATAEQLDHLRRLSARLLAGHDADGVDDPDWDYEDSDPGSGPGVVANVLDTIIARLQ